MAAFKILGRNMLTFALASASISGAVAQPVDGNAVPPATPETVTASPAPEAAPVPATPQPPAEATPPAAPEMAVGDIPVPPTSKGQVIFFRRGTIMGAAISCAVHENGIKLTSLPPGRYNVTITEPGIHSYSVKSEATDTLRMEIEPGETYYSECTIGMGFMAGRPNLSPSDKAAFLARLPKLKPAVNKDK